MQLLSADARMFLFLFFLPTKTWKKRPQRLLIIGPNLFFHSPAKPTAHTPELIFLYYKYVPRHSCLLICVPFVRTLSWRWVRHVLGFHLSRIATFVWLMAKAPPTWLYLAQWPIKNSGALTFCTWENAFR